MGTFNEENARRQNRRASWGGRRGHRERGGGEICGGPIRPVFGDDASGFGEWGDKPDYKTAALCKQVRRLVSLFLTGECGDPLLQSLIVEDVLPAPHAGRLLVRVILRIAEDEPANERIIDAIQRLGHVQGMLRARVGEGIVRKRTPEITFDVRAISTAPMSPPPEPEVRDE